MSSQPAQAWHPNPQLMQQQAQQPPVMPPTGWTGSWPPAAGFPPGYPGPPPMPGAPPRWNAGSWQYNPQMQNGQVPWAPGMGWGMPPNYNPYKRVPRPASPSYWKTELTDNGLGLEGMVKREKKDDQDDDEPQTPWIWSPPSLLADSEGRAPPERTFDLRRERPSASGSHARPASTPTREPVRNTDRRAALRDTPSTRSFEHVASSSTPVRPTTDSRVYHQTPDRGTPSRGEYIYRSNSHPHETAHVTTPVRHSSEPTRRSTAHQRSSSTGPSSSSSHHSTLNRGGSFTDGRSTAHASSGGNQYPAPATTSTANGRVLQSPVYSQEPDSYSSKAELQPTFPANIVRTPNHYQSSRRGTDEGTHVSQSPSRHGPPSGSNQGRSVPSAQPLMRHSSMPTTASRDPYSNFAEDMSGALPPSASAPRSSSRSTVPIVRSRTEPSVGPNLTTIPESASSASSGDQFFVPLVEPLSSSDDDDDDESLPDPSPRARRSPYYYTNDPFPNRSRSPRAVRHHSPSPYRAAEPSPTEPRQHEYPRRSPYSSRPSPDPSPRHHHHYDSHRSSSHSNGPSPRTPDDPSPPQHRSRRSSPPYSSSSSRRENPLPAPPMERPTLSASQPPPQEPPPAHWVRRVRHGFWNRRGDHLTQNLYVVYAPHDRAYPDELRDYPDESEGYQDHHGTFIPVAERPELPASLPQRGRPPAQPYDSFVVYKYS